MNTTNSKRIRTKSEHFKKRRRPFSNSKNLNRKIALPSGRVELFLIGNLVPKMSDDNAALEAGLFKRARIDGAIVFTNFVDQFELYPANGFDGGPTLKEQCGYDLLIKTMPMSQRNTTFKLKYANGEVYDAKLFARVCRGMPASPPLTIHIINVIFFKGVRTNSLRACSSI